MNNVAEIKAWAVKGDEGLEFEGFRYYIYMDKGVAENAVKKDVYLKRFKDGKVVEVKIILIK